MPRPRLGCQDARRMRRALLRDLVLAEPGSPRGDDRWLWPWSRSLSDDVTECLDGEDLTFVDGCWTFSGGRGTNASRLNAPEIPAREAENGRLTPAGTSAQRLPKVASEQGFQADARTRTEEPFITSDESMSAPVRSSHLRPLRMRGFVDAFQSHLQSDLLHE
jgi:hypothetical protein